MFTKRCLSLVMVALLVQPQLLVCGDDLDQNDGQEIAISASQEQKPVVIDQQDEALKASQASNEIVALRNTTVGLPGGFTISTDDRRVQTAIALAVILGAIKFFGLPNLPHG